MRLTLKNLGGLPVPVACKDHGGWVMKLTPREPMTIDKPNSKIWLIGDQPEFFREINKDTMGYLAAFGDILAFWRKKANDSDQKTVLISIHNRGDTPVRVVQGKGLRNDFRLEARQSQDFKSIEWIEIWELISEESMLHGSDLVGLT